MRWILPLAALMLAACTGPHVRPATNDTRAAGHAGATAPATDELEQAIEALRADMSAMRSIEQMAKNAVEASNAAALRAMKQRMDMMTIRHETTVAERDDQNRVLREQVEALAERAREAMDRADQADGRSRYLESQIRKEREARSQAHARLFAALGADVTPALERVLAEGQDGTSAVPDDARALAKSGLAAIREAKGARK